MITQEQLQQLHAMYPDKVPYADGRVHFSAEDDLYGVKIYRTDPILMYNYPCFAEWCNNFSDGKATIEQKEDATKSGEEAIYYEVVRIPDPTPEELMEQCRRVRDSMLEQYVDPLVTNPLRWADMDKEEQDKIANYRRYLLDYPESSDEWYKDYPLTYEDWLKL